MADAHSQGVPPAQGAVPGQAQALPYYGKQHGGGQNPMQHQQMMDAMMAWRNRPQAAPGQYHTPSAPTATLPPVQALPATPYSNQDIQGWFQQNPGATDQQVASTMDKYGVAAPQVGAAMNYSPVLANQRYQAAARPVV